MQLLNEHPSLPLYVRADVSLFYCHILSFAKHDTWPLIIDICCMNVRRIQYAHLECAGWDEVGSDEDE